VPTAAIETSHQYTCDEERAVIAAVQDALTTALHVPPWTTVIRLFVHQAHRFAAPPGKSDWYTLVSIDCFIGRSLETKRALYQAMVHKLGRCGIPADHIKVLLREAPRDNWGIRGGQPASCVALEYDVDI
jgi:phenylpyruvate tautomerase PptA (4-oxalocrotonate tautomerase family)